MARNQQPVATSRRVRLLVESGPQTFFFFQNTITDVEAEYEKLHGRTLDPNFFDLQEKMAFKKTLYWDLPEGRLLPGETSVQAAKRLLYRQLGLELLDGFSLRTVRTFNARFRPDSHYEYVWVRRWGGELKYDPHTSGMVGEGTKTKPKGRPCQWIPLEFVSCYAMPSETLIALQIMAQSIPFLAETPTLMLGQQKSLKAAE